MILVKTVDVFVTLLLIGLLVVMEVCGNYIRPEAKQKLKATMYFLLFVFFIIVVKKVMEVILEAQNTAIEHISSGVEASKIDNIARKVYIKTGIMEENKVGSIVVVDDEQKPLGIFTDNDLRKVVLYGDKHDQVKKFMSSPPIAIDAKKPLFDAYTTMINHGIDHLIITNNGAVIGVITSKDILSQLEPSYSVLALYRKAIKATSIEELKIVFEKMNVAVAKMALRGLHFYDLSKMITSVHDAVVVKTIEILRKNYDVENFVWIHMGSSGRKEQIIATDQDNAMISSGSENMLEFAKAVNEALAKIGIPKCPANYMASNKRWNTDIETWKGYFKKWFNEPIPDHIRYLSIFLDMRPIYGDKKLYNELLEFIEDNATNQAIRFLALDATLIEPPIGIFGIKNLKTVSYTHLTLPTTERV